MVTTLSIPVALQNCLFKAILDDVAIDLPDQAEPVPSQRGLAFAKVDWV